MLGIRQQLTTREQTCLHKTAASTESTWRSLFTLTYTGKAALSGAKAPFPEPDSMVCLYVGNKSGKVPTINWRTSITWESRGSRPGEKQQSVYLVGWRYWSSQQLRQPAARTQQLLRSATHRTTPISHPHLQSLSAAGVTQQHAFISGSPYLQHIFVSAHLRVSSDEATQDPEPASRIRGLLQNPHPDSQGLFGLIRLVEMEPFLYLLLCLVLTHLPYVKKPHTLPSQDSEKEALGREPHMNCVLKRVGWSCESPAMSRGRGRGRRRREVAAQH